MKKIDTDVDIDCANRDKILSGLWHVNAGIKRDKKMEKHPSGVYFQPIPRNPYTNVSTIDHQEAGEYGYFKIDLLNSSLYERVRDEQHLNQLIDKEPDWDLLQDQKITDQLIHIKNHNKLLKKFKPKSVEDLAIILALIRPQKAFLQEKSWDVIKKEIWKKSSSDHGYAFKRSHAIAYSLAIIVNLNLIIEELK